MQTPGNLWSRLQEAPGEQLSNARLTTFLAELVGSDPRNALPENGHPAIWETPLISVASASDPFWESLKSPGVVGPIHRSPHEWLEGARSVIVWFLPYSERLRRGYPKKSFMPSLEWVSGRRNGEVFNNVTRRGMIRLIEQHGGRAVAPSNALDYRAERMLPMWSERHAAWIAGLGTFGIHGALITKSGCAGRIGSIVTNLELPPTPRPYQDVYQYCPYPYSGKCGACIPRCPVDAISAHARDNQKCVEHGRDTVGEHFRPWGYHSCGHCLTWLPCVDRIPPQSLFSPSSRLIPASH